LALRGGGLARGQRLGGRQAGHARARRDRAPCLISPRYLTGANWTAPTAPARLPAATCVARHYAAYARPTSDAEQSLHTGLASRLAHPRKFQKKTNKPWAIWRLRAKVQKPAETRFWAPPADAKGLPADGVELGGGPRVREGPWARARPPRRSHGQLCPGEEVQDSEGRPPLGRRSGGAGSRAPIASAGARPAIARARLNREPERWTAPVMSPGVRRPKKQRPWQPGLPQAFRAEKSVVVSGTGEFGFESCNCKSIKALRRATCFRRRRRTVVGRPPPRRPAPGGVVPCRCARRPFRHPTHRSRRLGRPVGFARLRFDHSSCPGRRKMRPTSA
jgi:hypothetical protein